MIEAKNHLFLSPHLDDAIWSSGGRMAYLLRHGEKVTVITVFCGIVDTTQGVRWRQIANARVRERENSSAITSLGVQHMQLDYLEAALRTDAAGKFICSSPDDLFQNANIHAATLLPQLRQTLEQVLNSSWETINVPLAMGGHVDHILVRHVAETIVKQNLFFYEDFPYRFEPVNAGGLRAQYLALSDDDVDAWLCAAEKYRSQVLWLFGRNRLFTDALLARTVEHGQCMGVSYGDRCWRN
jgi:LmbE family N-acetylglucosaminyl deacetylase